MNRHGVPVRVAAPTAYPLTLAEQRAFSRIDAPDDDLVLASLIAKWTAHFDGYGGVSGQALMEQTWEQRLPAFPASPVRLWVPPVQSVVVTYYDAEGVLQTVADADYAVQQMAQGPHLVLQAGATWPASYVRTDAVIVTYVAGHAEPHDVPENLRHQIWLLVDDEYNKRGTTDILASDTIAYLHAKDLPSAF